MPKAHHRHPSILVVGAGLLMGAAGLTLLACSATTGGGGMSSQTLERTPPAQGEAPVDIAAQIEADAAAAMALRDAQPAPAQPTPSFADAPSTRRPDPVVTEGTPPAANISPAISVDEPAPAAAAIEVAPDAPELTTDEWITRLSQELAMRLREKAAASESPFGALATLAAMDLVTPGLGAPGGTEPNMTLTPAEDRALSAWREALSEASSALQAGGGPEALGAIADRVAASLDADRPLDITRLALCTRVDGYGLYEEFATTSFLAQRRRPAIVYVEVDHFTAEPATGGGGEAGFRVELIQGVSLYHSDGTLAWRQTDQETVDFSRNRRRDFFVVQRIELPETLTVGSYNLKVTMRDKASGAVAERTLPISIVADASLTHRAPGDR